MEKTNTGTISPGSHLMKNWSLTIVPSAVKVLTTTKIVPNAQNVKLLIN